MDLVLALLKNEYNEYKAELKSFADYGASIIDNYAYYLKNRKNLSTQRKQQIKMEINKINTLVTKLREFNQNGQTLF